jgi:hypothetical protein
LLQTDNNQPTTLSEPLQIFYCAITKLLVYRILNEVGELADFNQVCFLSIEPRPRSPQLGWWENLKILASGIY